MTSSVKYPSEIKSGTTNTLGVKAPRKTPAIPGSSFQNASNTCAKMLRRRNSAACWYVGALDSAFKVDPWPITIRVESENSSVTNVICLRNRTISARYLAHSEPRRGVQRCSGSNSKAPEHWRTPGRFAKFGQTPRLRNGVWVFSFFSVTGEKPGRADWMSALQLRALNFVRPQSNRARGRDLALDNPACRFILRTCALSSNE